MCGRVAAGATAKDRGSFSDAWLSSLPLQVLVPPVLHSLEPKGQPCRGSNHGAAWPGEVPGPAWPSSTVPLESPPVF